MLFVDETGETGPLIVMLHWLGGSTRTWQEVSRGLARRGFCCAAVDLPGFGQEAYEMSSSISEVIRQVVETIRRLREGRREGRLILAGHSMGGKLAMALARMASDGMEGLENLAGILLVSPSPPGPEPMSESKRGGLAKSLGPAEDDDEKRRQNAEKFIDDNTGRLSLLPEVKERAVADVLRMNPDALMAWLTDGSREDWSERVGRLQLPALVFAGSEDEALGADAQREHTLPHLERAVLITLEGGGHLAPLERPAELVDRIAEFCREIGVAGAPKNLVLGPAVADLIESDQTSPRTRAVLLERLPDPKGGGVFSSEELRTLRALVARVVPDAGFDLAKRIDHALAEPVHDGWRFDHLPADQQAWKQGLLSLDLGARRKFNVPFVALDAARQDELLTRAQNGELGRGLLGAMHMGDSESAFDEEQMRDWFEDVRGELAKLYVSDPRTMERIGFTGFADEKGFTQIRLGDGEETSS